MTANQSNARARQDDIRANPGNSDSSQSLRLVAYLRVSTDVQAEHGHGLDVQRDAIAAWAARAGHRIVAWHSDEGISGSNGLDTRAGLYDALDAIKHRKAAGIAVYNLDRLARKLTVQEAVLAMVWTDGGKVYSVEDHGEILEDDPDDPMRTAMRQMRGVFAQLERAMIAKRMRDGRRAKAAKGGYACGAPRYGWRAEGGELVAVDDEQKVLARIRRRRSSGVSLRAIAAELNQAGIPAKRGGEWTPEALRRICEQAGSPKRRRTSSTPT